VIGELVTQAPPLHLLAHLADLQALVASAAPRRVPRLIGMKWRE
jgi:hypothetical protein